MNSLDKKFDELIDDLNVEQREIFREVYKNLKKSREHQKHSMLQLALAKYFIKKGYDVRAEYQLISRYKNGSNFDKLVCDLWIENEKNYVIEVETKLKKTRIISKTARYSNNSDYFGLAFTTTPDIPTLFLQPPHEREEKEIKMMKKLCDRKYRRPYINEDMIRNAKIDFIYIIDKESLEVKEIKLSGENIKNTR